MKINVSLIALGGGGAGAERQLEMADGATLADVMAALALPRGETYATLLNGQSVPTAERATRPMKDGDTLTVFPPLEGG